MVLALRATSKYQTYHLVTKTLPPYFKVKILCYSTLWHRLHIVNKTSLEFKEERHEYTAKGLRYQKRSKK
jgi:hypothetical protein